jgi:putative ABC transport system ATP-binding protein
MRLEARELSLSYECPPAPATAAVRLVDLDAGPVGQTGIMGPSGSGKSSLLYLLSGLKRPTSGTVFLDGRNLLQYSETEMDALRRERLGFIFQRHCLIGHLTLLENALLPIPKPTMKDRARLADEMEALGLAANVNKYPHAVSVGERQKAAIVRALANRPEILFCDEPTAALDQASAIMVMNYLAERMKDACTLVVTHDYRILRHAGRILQMRDGRLAET